MNDGRTGGARQLRALIALSLRRLVALVTRPALGTMLGAGVPVVAVLGAMVAAARSGLPRVEGASGGATLGLLVAGAVAFAAYGVLFRASDGSFLRSIGADAGAVFLERSLRLGALGMTVCGAMALPFGLAGERFGWTLAVGASAALIATGTAALGYAAAARMIATGTGRWLGAGIVWDPELAKAGPLIYAPLVPLLAGAGYGALAGASAGARLGIILIAGLGLGIAGAFAGSRVMSTAAPGFHGRAAEMAFVPIGRGEVSGFRARRGLAVLLPGRAAAVWVRDALVAGRRFAWAARVSWPVAIVAMVTLARWGESPMARGWVIGLVALALVIQGAAVIGLGVLERRGPGWLDRSTGLLRWERFLGRWAWSWELSLWLLVPVALAWFWWSGAPGAHLLPIAGLLASATASTASLIVSGRR